MSQFKLIKVRCCAWDLNPGWQDGRRRRIHWAMATPFKLIVISNIFYIQDCFHVILVFSKRHCNFFLKKNNVHPVFGVGIRTPHILNMNLPQKPLDQGSHPYMQKVVIKLSKRLYHFLSHFLSNTARLIQPSLIVGQRIQMFDSPALNLALNYTTPFSVSYNISCHILFRIKSSLIVG